VNRQLSAAVLATFRDAHCSAHSRRLQQFSTRQWQHSLHWLDASGLALYFLHRLNLLDIVEALPTIIGCQLEQRQKDNQRRTAALLAECARLNAAFRNAALSYVNLKGFTLVPDYCPALSLRCQMDCDFLIDRRDAARCQEILRAHGYSRIAAKPHVMEFKTDAGRTPGIADLYKARPEKSVEVHLCNSERSEFEPGLLARAGRTPLDAEQWPSLLAGDQFLLQAFHLWRHLRSEWTRLSWLLELRQCIVVHSGDETFWERIRERATQTARGVLAVGIAVRMAEKAFGDFAPRALTSWSYCRLPAEVNLWVEHFGDDVLLADFPGSKLYLILESAIRGKENPSTIRQKLVPRHLPAAIVPNPRARFGRRLLVARTQCSYFWFRLRFHIAAGFRYLLATRRWKRAHQRPIEITAGAPAGCVVTRAD